MAQGGGGGGSRCVIGGGAEVVQVVSKEGEDGDVKQELENSVFEKRLHVMTQLGVPISLTKLAYLTKH
ncbi:hypothetical protein L2E82_27172 [Cichorium intybus]|uniref:Uncharacterized protein n=1 Tax=Cichorium intybus TaxID=13427 RepID=A0ACB9CSD3_CICIN|nr:hypothetical protein L2E82_27172 [Cichorium intybus]